MVRSKPPPSIVVPCCSAKVRLERFLTAACADPLMKIHGNGYSGSEQIDIAPAIDSQPGHAATDMVDVQPEATIGRASCPPAGRALEMTPDLPIAGDLQFDHCYGSATTSGF